MERLPILLIVEDRDLAALMAQDIEGKGYETFVATSVGDALRLLAQQGYSAIVADYFGPRLEFPYRWPILQLLARFAPRTPVLALSVLPEVPKSGNLAAVVRLPDYENDLAKGLRRHALSAPEHSRDPLLARYLAALWEAEVEEGAKIVFEATKAGWNGATIYEELFTAALYEIGKWWEGDSCTVADEHGARAMTERLMAGVSAVAERRPAEGRSIVIACVESERHELGARMAADVFDWNGWQVRLLGADTPMAELIGEASRRKADVVGLSATMRPSWMAIRLLVEALRGEGIKAVMLGGQAFRQLDEGTIAALGAVKADRLQLCPEQASKIVGQRAGA